MPKGKHLNHSQNDNKPPNSPAGSNSSSYRSVSPPPPTRPRLEQPSYQTMDSDPRVHPSRRMAYERETRQQQYGDANYYESRATTQRQPYPTSRHEYPSTRTEQVSRHEYPSTRTEHLSRREYQSTHPDHLQRHDLPPSRQEYDSHYGGEHRRQLYYTRPAHEQRQEVPGQRYEIHRRRGSDAQQRTHLDIPNAATHPHDSRHQNLRSIAQLPIVRVTSLTANVTAAHLSEIFSPYGQILRINLTQGTNKAAHVVLWRGWQAAVIEFAEKSMAEKALRCMHGGQIDGSTVSVSWWQQK